MAQHGYYQKPTLHGDTVVFVSEDDLWAVPATGGVARRLTASPGRVDSPRFSPDGKLLAYASRDEGHFEVHVMPAEGGESRRLTYLGAHTFPVGWTRDGTRVVFATNARQPFARVYVLGSVPAEGGVPDLYPWGPASSLSFAPEKGVVLGRFTSDPARWKRYRGGTVGQHWIDPEERGHFRLLPSLGGNVTAPMWIGERIWFGSDHEGVGNLYSCLPDGSGLQRHTRHEDFYLRHPSSDGQRIVYQCGADLFLYSPGWRGPRKIRLEYRSPRVQRRRRFPSAARYLEEYDPHPRGHTLLLTVRGRPYQMANWEEGVLAHGQPEGVRYRLNRWLPDGERFVCVSDASGEEQLEVHRIDRSGEPRVVDPDFDLGRPVSLVVCPVGERVALANHRFELLLADLEKGSIRPLDRSRHGRIAGMAWSPDGRWLAYGLPETAHTCSIKLCRIDDGAIFPVTRPEFRDFNPAFDPQGRYLYFLSLRDFDPVYDHLHFDLGFPRAMRPYLVTLRRDLPSPFVPRPRAPGSEEEEKKNKEESPKAVEIDVEGIENRVVAFPVSEGRYGQVVGLPRDKVLYTTFPVEGSLQDDEWPPSREPPARGTLLLYDLQELEETEWTGKVTDFAVTPDSKTLVVRSGNRLRVLPAGKKPENKSGDSPGRKSGWVDLSRVRPSVNPPSEWRQIFREAWRLMRDHFWVEDMAGVDWEAVYRQYEPLLERISTRSELSDLLWEVQGELGTSHAYEFGGDFPPEPRYPLGHLAADFRWDARRRGYRVVRVAAGDPWDPKQSSPLVRPGVGIRPGDVVLAINGRRLSAERDLHEHLVHTADCEVQLTVRSGRKTRRVFVRTLRSDTAARYREWVRENRRRVHEASSGRVGYLHIPNMGPEGFAEFHRGFLAEVDRPGLIVDVRYNGGGHVSPLLLEKLSRRRLGYDVKRWGEPDPYPRESPMGPMVALCNEQAGSDGDIFCHAFKLLGLGPLVGKRTWGGVIGIWPTHYLVDGGLTTQPEFAFWFEDVGWGLENYGTEPDVEVEFPPQDYRRGRDPQLERALELVLEELERNPPRLPRFPERPHRARPRLRK